jgi:AcrR family transcriptional regulator
MSSVRKAAKPAKVALSRAVFAEAAIRCFQKYGSHRTSMSDIADEAGASRQSVYRFFEDRSTLIQYILNKRISLMGEALRSVFNTYASLPEAIVEGSLASLTIGWSDELYLEIISHNTDHGLELFLYRGTKEIHQIMMEIWGPLLDRARASGELRQDLTNSQIVDWIRHVHASLAIRDDLDAAARRKILENFLLPSVQYCSLAATPSGESTGSR